MSYIKRIERLQNKLISQDIEFFIIEDPLHLFYLTGLEIEGQLIVGQNTTRLFVDSRYFFNVKKRFPNVFLKKEDLLFDFFVLHSKGGKIGLDGNYFSYQRYLSLKSFIEKLEKQASSDISFNLVSLPDLLKDLRSVKTQEEIFFLRKAASINWRGFNHICSLLKEGVCEKTLAKEFEIFCLQNGAKLAFPPIIAFGENTAFCHHVPTNRLFQKKDAVLIDIGVEIDHYRSDMTRVLFFEENPALQEFYEIVRRAHSYVLTFCKPGTSIGTLDEKAREIISSKGYEKEFLHALGHGIGLETHEFPRIQYNSLDKDVILEPGMVITIEPGLYQEGVGGVRYEDTIVITNEGFENFYTSH